MSIRIYAHHLQTRVRNWVYTFKHLFLIALNLGLVHLPRFFSEVAAVHQYTLTPKGQNTLFKNCQTFCTWKINHSFHLTSSLDALWFSSLEAISVCTRWALLCNSLLPLFINLGQGDRVEEWSLGLGLERLLTKTDIGFRVWRSCLLEEEGCSFWILGNPRNSWLLPVGNIM